MSYATASVGEVAQQVRGVTYKKADASREPRAGTVGVVRAGNIRAGELTLDDLVFVPSSRISEQQMLRRGDVLIAASSGSLDVVGKAARVRDDQPVAFGGFCKVLRPGPQVDPGYFAHFFQTSRYRAHVSAAAAGANINNLRNSDLDDLELPLPSLAEQRRIAAVLDAAHDLRVLRRTALQQVRCLHDAATHQFLSAVYEWEPKPLGQAVQQVTVGHVGPTSAHFCDAADDGVPFIRTGNVGDGEILRKDLRHISRSFDRTHPNSRLREGDLVISRVISRTVRAAIVPPDLDGANCANVIIVRPGTKLTSTYLLALIRLPASQRALLGRRVGSAQSVVNTKVLQKWKVPVPPQDALHRLEGIAAAVDALAERSRASLAHLTDLQASLQQRAFAGEL